MGKKAIVAGASGLTGRALVEELLARSDIISVVTLVRTSTGLQHPKLREKVIDFEAITELPCEWFEEADFYCTLGTTIKKAGSKQQFAKVDYEYPLALAQKGKICGIRQMLIVTALGSNKFSPFFFSRVKGRLEEALKQLNLPGLRIFQPSLIIGQRNENRRGEEAAAKAMGASSFLFKGPLAKYGPIQGKTIAQAMVYTALQENVAHSTCTGSKSMQQMADALLAGGDNGENQ